MMRPVGTPAASARHAPERRARPRRSVASIVLLALAATWTAAFVVVAGRAGNLGWDLVHAYLPAARAVLAGESPYPSVDDPVLEDQKGYVYPPQLALALAPLAPAPERVVAVGSALILLALAALTLVVLEVRDPRCYAAAFLSLPLLGAATLANLSIPLALALALAWRYRDRPRGSGLAIGLAVSAKLVLWPVVVWALASRRWRATAVAVLSGALVTVGAWALIGFRGAREYPALLRRLSEIQSENSYSLVGVAATVGLPSAVGRVATLAVGGALLVACLRFARRGDDLRSFTSAVLASLAASPIVWLHYLFALFVPLSIARPRFSPLWLVPLVLIVSPRPGYPDGYEALAPLVVVVVVGAALLARPGLPAPAPVSAGGRRR